MKTAIYIEDGVTQLVLTAQGETDQKVLDALEGQEGLSINRGSFYECRGGWVAQAEQRLNGFYSSGNSERHRDDSLIFTVREKKPFTEKTFSEMTRDDLPKSENAVE